MEKIRDDEQEIVFEDEYHVPVHVNSPQLSWGSLLSLASLAFMFMGITESFPFFVEADLMKGIIIYTILVSIGIILNLVSMMIFGVHKSPAKTTHTKRTITIDRNEKSLRTSSTYTKDGRPSYKGETSYDLRQLKKTEVKREFFGDWYLLLIFANKTRKIEYINKIECIEIRDAIRRVLRENHDEQEITTHIEQQSDTQHTKS